MAKNPHAVALGRKGGQSKSAAKRAAVARNLTLARAARKPSARPLARAKKAGSESESKS